MQFIFFFIVLKIINSAFSRNYLIGETGKDHKISKKSMSLLDVVEIRKSYGISLNDRKLLILDRAGIYSISITVVVKTEYDDVISLMTSPNNNYVKSKALKSVVKEKAGTFTVIQNSLIKCNKLDELSVFLTSKYGELEIMKESFIYLFLISTNNLIPGFSVTLLKDSKKEIESESKWQVPIRLSWSSVDSPMSFSQTNMFLYSDNYMVIERSGTYFISGNMIIKNTQHEECYHSFKVLKNNFKTVFIASEETSKDKSHFTISFNYFTTLDKSDILFIEVWTECLYTMVSKDSRFSLLFFENKVFSSKLSDLKTFLFKNGWVKVTPRYFSQTADHSSAVQPSEDGWEVQRSGLYMLSVNFLLMARQNTQDLKLKISKESNGSLPIIVNGNSASSQTFLSGTFVNYFTEKENINPTIYFPKNDRFLLVVNSTFSGAFFEQDDFPEDSKENIKIDFTNWKQLTLIENSEFWYTKNNMLKVTDSGIYFVTSSFFVLPSENCQVYISIIFDHGDIRKQKQILSIVSEVSSHGKFLMFSSAMRINIDQKVGLYIRSGNLCQVNIASQFQMKYLGTCSSIIGFQSNFLTDQKYHENGKTLSNYYDSARVEISQSFSYNTGRNFSHDDGKYTAPHNGVYIVSANIIIKGIQKGSLIGVRLSINDSPTSFYEVKEARVDDAILTVSLTASLELFKADRVKLVMTSSNEKEYIIDKSSSFSIVYINNFARSITTNAVRNENKVYQGESSARIVGWKLTRMQSELNIHKTPEIIDTEYIQIKVSGEYVISVNILYRNSYKSDSIILAIIKKTEKGFSEYKCFVETYFIRSMTMHCTLLLQLMKGDLISFQIKKGDTTLDTEKENEVAIDNIYKYGYLSLTLFNDPCVHQMSLVKLQRQPLLEFGSENVVLKHWHGIFTVSKNGDNGFSMLNGDLHARSTGWYLFTGKLVYDKEFGNVTIGISRINHLISNLISSVSGPSVESELNFGGIIYLERSSKIAFTYKGFGPGSITPMGVEFTFCYLSEQRTTKHVLMTSSQLESNKHVLIWKNEIGQGDLIEFEDIGVFIILSSITVKTSGDNLKFSLELNDAEESIIEYSNVSDGFRTYLLSAIFAIQSRKQSIKILLQTNGRYELLSLSPTYISKISDGKFYAMAKLKTTSSTNVGFWDKNLRLDIRAFETKSNENIYYKNSKLVVKYSGLYFISLHLIVKCDRTNKLSVGLHVNTELIIESMRTCSSVSTLTMINTLNLKQGSIIYLSMKSLEESEVTIVEASSFNILLIERMGVDEERMVPVITDELYRGSILNMDGNNTSASLQCNTIPNNDVIKYKWYRNSKELAGHDQQVLSLQELSLQEAYSGDYQCQAMYDGIGPISKPTRVNAQDINECETGEHNCHGSNVTCVNTVRSYYCKCQNGLEYIDGKCDENEDKENEKSESTAITKPKIITLLLLILVPIGSLVCLIMLGLSVCLYIRHREKREDEEAIALACYDDDNNDDMEMQGIQDTTSDDHDIQEIRRNSRNASIATSQSYAPSNINHSEDEDDVAGFEEHKWKKLKATTSV